MPDLALEWANVERLVLQHLRARTGAEVYTETGTDLAAVAAARGAILVERSGGRGRGIEKDVDVMVAVHAGTRSAMWQLARDVESAMADLEADATAEGYVDGVEEAFGFAAEPYSNPAVRRASATYTLTVRPR